MIDLCLDSEQFSVGIQLEYDDVVERKERKLTAYPFRRRYSL